jgi:hypothetical protein
MGAGVAASVWPLFDLAVETPRLRLEYANDDHLQALARFRRGDVLGNSSASSGRTDAVSATTLP